MSHRETWETYATAWRTTDPGERRTLFESALDTECTYRDPTTEAQGWDALSAYMDAFQKMIPGGGFVTKTFMMHHDRTHVSWEMVTSDGTVAGVGNSFGRFDKAGKLVEMTGFFETDG